MRRIPVRIAFVVAALFIFLSAGSYSASGLPGNETIRGWISDEGCARGRAEDGVFTQTSGSCARECILKDHKATVVIDPDHKRVLTITNPAAVRSNIGNYVEIEGQLEQDAKAFHVESVKLLAENSSMCALPAKKTAH